MMKLLSQVNAAKVVSKNLKLRELDDERQYKFVSMVKV